MLNASAVASIAQATLAGYVGFTLRRGAKTAGRRRLARALLSVTAFAVCYGLVVAFPWVMARDIGNFVALSFGAASAWEVLLYVSWLSRGAKLAEQAGAPRWRWLALYISTAALTLCGVVMAAISPRREQVPQFGLLFVIGALLVVAVFVALRARRRKVGGAGLVAVGCALLLLAVVANVVASLGWLPPVPYVVLRDACLLLYSFLLFQSYLDDGHEPMSIDNRVVAGALTAVLAVGSIGSRMTELFIVSTASPEHASALRVAMAARFLVLIVVSGGLVITLVPQLFRRSVFRPLARLTGALTELERGEHVALEVDHEDEIGRLTRSFNSMAKALAEGKKTLEDKVSLLEAKQEEVEGLNEELRRQVIARSRQLSDVLGRVGPASHALEPGAVIDDRYRIDGRLGAGGMGVVYAVTRLTDTRPLALKVMAEGTGREDGMRFAREAEIAAGLAHENLVGVLDVGLYEGVAYLVMERIDGGSLEDARDQFGDVAWALALLGQIAEGLVVLHGRSILHRDLKPANILLARTGRATVAKISDFGIARQQTANALATMLPQTKTAPLAPAPTAAGAIVGTLAYMAPELSRGPNATPASDVFAFGVVAYELLTKRPPFPVPAVLETMAGRTLGEPHALPVVLAKPIADALRASVSADPAHRPTAQELRSLIKGIQG